MVTERTIRIRLRFNRARIGLILALGLVAIPRLLEAQIGFEEPAWASEAGASHAQWLNFAEAFNAPNTPDVDGSTADATLTQTVPGAIVTGGQNIYNPAGASVFEIGATVAGPLREVTVQTWISGTELDYESMVLEYMAEGQTRTLGGVHEELGRQSGPQGDTVVARWHWDLGQADTELSEVRLRVEASGAHASLVAARLDLLEASNSGTMTVLFDAPDADRWNYLFNATPGRRSVASTFRAIAEGAGIDRHGVFVIGFDTAGEVTPGLPAARYVVQSARLTVVTSGNFEVIYDDSHDPVESYLPDDHERFSADADPGRPVELFGTGFRNGFSAETWEETTAWAPDEESDRSVFPAFLSQDGEIVDATRAVVFAKPSIEPPFAIGGLDEIAPGELLPEDTAIHFDVDVSRAQTVQYIQRSLSAGKLFFTVTSLHGGGQGARTFPEFYTKDSLLGEPPTLELVLSIGEGLSEVRIERIIVEQDRVLIRFNHQPDAGYRIRHTTNLTEWVEVSDPELTLPETGVAEWADLNPSAIGRFYQVLLVP